MTALGFTLGSAGIVGSIEGNRGRGPRRTGGVSYPHFEHAAAPLFTRVPHATQGRPLGFVTSWRRSLIPSTRTHENGRHLILAYGSLMGSRLSSEAQSLKCDACRISSALTRQGSRAPA